MKRFSFLLIMLLFPLCLLAQKDDTPQKFYVGIDFAFNYSKLGTFYLNTFEEDDLRYTVRPAIGLYAKQLVMPRLYLKGEALYSRKASALNSPNYRFVNSYVDMSLIPQFEVFNDVFIQAGFCYSYLLNADFKRASKKQGRTFSTQEVFGFDSEKTIVAGIELKLQNNVNLELNYYIPLAEGTTQNFQVGFNILLNNQAPKTVSQKVITRRRSSRQIKELNRGTLLVRLKTSENTIRALKEVGLTEKAEEVRAQQEAENKEIVSAFKQHYTFSEVAFFYSNNSRNVKEKNYDNIFLDDSLMIDPSVTISGSKPVFIAAFGPLKQDTARYLSSWRYEPDKDWSLEKKKEYYGGTNFGFQALKVMDENFVQLKDPFPFYVRAMYRSMAKHPEQSLFLLPILPFQNWSAESAVSELNRKLLRYHKKQK